MAKAEQKFGINWLIEKRKVSDLKEWDKNPREISSDELLRLEEKIKKNGLHDILVVDNDNVVLSGNQRLKILIKQTVDEVFVMYPERKLTEDERLTVALESNINEGRWIYDQLAKDFNKDMLLGLGFSEYDINFEKTKQDLKDDFEEFEKGGDNSTHANKQILLFTFDTEEEKLLAMNALGIKSTTAKGVLLLQLLSLAPVENENSDTN